MDDQAAAIHVVAAYDALFQHLDHIVVLLAALIENIRGERRVRLVVIDAVFFRRFLPGAEIFQAVLVACVEGGNALMVHDGLIGIQMVDVRVRRVKTRFVNDAVCAVNAVRFFYAAGLHANFHHGNTLLCVSL